MASFDSEELRKYKKELEDTAKIQKHVTKDVKSWLDMQGDIIKLSGQINDIKRKNARLHGEINNLEGEYSDLANSSLQADKNKAKELRKQIDLRKKVLSDNDEVIKDYEKQASLLRKQAVNWKNIASAIGGSVYKGLKKNWKYYLDQDKASRTTALSMGLTGKHLKDSLNTWHKTALETAKIGFGVAEIAKMQGRYSDQLGRAVLLTSKSQEQMAYMAKSTMLGADGAADLAAEFDKFGISAERTAEFMEDTVNLATDMGINSAKASKLMQQNLKLAQRWNFKGGVKNLKTMVMHSLKFKASLEETTQMADKLFEPEGAVEMAAHLQVLGGGFSKLADPFKLMFMARNDMEGLHEAITDAVSGLAQWDGASESFKISAQEIHKLKYVAEATGMSMEELTNRSYGVARAQTIEGQIGTNIDPKYHELISNMATINKSGKAEISVKDENGAMVPKLVKDLSNTTLQIIASDQATLKKRAEDSRTFSEVWTGLLEQVKTALLPLLQGIDKALRVPLDRFTKWIQDKQVIEKISSMAAKIGGYLVDFAEWVASLPKEVLMIGAGIMGALKVLQWFGYGIQLGMGFNSVARVQGGGNGMLDYGGRSFRRGGRFKKIGKMFGGKKTWAGRQMRNMAAKNFKAGRSMGGVGKGIGVGRGMGGMGRGMGGIGRGAGLIGRGAGAGRGLTAMGAMGTLGKGATRGIGLGLAGAGLGIGKDYLTEQGHLDAGSHGWKAMGIGSSALEGAGWGSLFGPWGTAIGAVLGAGKGVYDNYIKKPDPVTADVGYQNPWEMLESLQDPDRTIQGGFISKDGKVTQISDNDNIRVGKNIGSKGSGSGGEFTVNGTIKVVMDDTMLGSIDLSKNTTFVRSLILAIEEQTSAIANQVPSPQGNYN